MLQPSLRQTRISQDVVFDEDTLWYTPAPIYAENKEPSDATNHGSNDEASISVAADTDQTEGPKTLELTGSEPSNNHNTTWNECEMSRD